MLVKGATGVAILSATPGNGVWHINYQVACEESRNTELPEDQCGWSKSWIILLSAMQYSKNNIYTVKSLKSDSPIPPT